jgi:hypothetical protein
MEKIKKFLNSPKKTAILGLVGIIIILIPVLKFIIGEDLFELSIISMYHTYIWGLLIYFAIVLLRILKNKGNIKIANYILIITLVVTIICDFLAKQIVNAIVLLILELYLINILIKKKTFINNKIALITMLIYIVYSIILPNYRIYFFVQSTLDYVTQIIGYICIIPYFYGYYILLNKGGN